MAPEDDVRAPTVHWMFTEVVSVDSPATLLQWEWTRSDTYEDRADPLRQAPRGRETHAPRKGVETYRGLPGGALRHSTHWQ